MISSTMLLVADALLRRFNIHLSYASLETALTDHASIYSQLLRLPIKNIFNEIIFQHAYDYQVFLQKLFIDYHLSPAYAKDTQDKDAPISPKQQQLDGYYDETNQAMKALSDAQFKHYQLISESQAFLIGAIKNIKNLTNELKKLLDDSAFINTTNQFLERAEDNRTLLLGYQQAFYDLILKTSVSLQLLTDYHPDEEGIREAMNNIAFDPSMAN
jgi:hypothetical protein